MNNIKKGEYLINKKLSKIKFNSLNIILKEML